MYDIIPDIHGQIEKLHGTLKRLGYAKRKGAWRHSDAARTCIFLGDYIDRGANNAAVLETVRRMVDAGTAQAIMGNHELNAIQFHTVHPNTGLPLRARTEKNGGQHKTFLDEFPTGAARTGEQIGWMKQLPLFLELEKFRAVHACWDGQKIQRLGHLANNGILSDTQFVQVADKAHELHDLVETTAKGPETPLPDGYSIKDQGGQKREDIRVQWWNSNADSWADIAMSVPDKDELPTTPLPQNITKGIYSPDAAPVFFGHYWLSGRPVLQAPNALCLDYSAGKDGPLVSYRFQKEAPALSLVNLTGHSSAA